MVNPRVLTAGQLLTPDVVHSPGWVMWEGQRLVDLGSGTPPRSADHEFPQQIVMPGFVDTHVHGGGGGTFSASPEESLRAAEFHRAHGTTTMVASLVTLDIPELDRAVRSLAELVDDEVLAGTHLEGPWLSPHCKGAHDAALLRAPSPDDVARLMKAGRGTVRTVTIAPELEGGVAAIRQVTEAGAVAAVGHTNATYAQTIQALGAGARVATHLFNAMRPVHHREPGPVPALLESEDIFIELIADGLHLHPAVLRTAARQSAQPVLVTDAIAATGQPDGDYRLGSLEVTVDGGRARLRGSETIAGSTLTLGAAIRYCVTVAGLTIQEAVRAATLTPSEILNRTDIGRLAPGARADLVVLDRDLHVTDVLHRGSWVRDLK